VTAQIVQGVAIVFVLWWESLFVAERVTAQAIQGVVQSAVTGHQVLACDCIVVQFFDCKVFNTEYV